MSRALVAVAGSPGDAEVLRAAHELASRAGVKLTGVIVAEKRDQAPEFSEGTRWVARGVAWKEICKTAHVDDTDLVIIGASRHGASGRPLGSTAASVANHCDRSVLVVRRWSRPPSRVLVAIDGSERAATVRDFAAELARRMGGKIRLFHVFDMPSVVPADMVGEFPTLEDALRDAATRLLGVHEQATPAELRDGMTAGVGAAVWPEICEAARRYHADLVVVGSHSYGLVDRLLGSTAAKVVEYADGSVLVVKQAWRD